MIDKIEAAKDKAAIESIKECAQPFDYKSIKITKDDLKDQRVVTAGIKGIMILKTQKTDKPQSIYKSSIL